MTSWLPVGSLSWQSGTIRRIPTGKFITIWNIILHQCFFYTLAPTKAKELQLATEYLSVDNWIAEGGLGGLIYDANRSRMVAKNSSTRMTPQEVANIPGNANRDFKLVWTKK